MKAIETKIISNFFVTAKLGVDALWSDQKTLGGNVLEEEENE